MSANYVGPNVRGTAKRDNEKDKRIATHTNVLKMVISKLLPTIVIEHGMGRSSTPLFHELEIQHIISIEDEDEWMKCRTCDSNKGKFLHTITTFNDFDESIFSLDPEKTILFLDGSDDQRKKLFTQAVNKKIIAIIEHDAESFSAERVQYIKELGTNKGYELYQYINENPETCLYVLKDKLKIDMTDFVEL